MASLESNYRTASSASAKQQIAAEWDQVLAFLCGRDDLFSGATVTEIAGGLNWSADHTKIVLWNMLDRNLVTRSGSCMDEATFNPV